MSLAVAPLGGRHHAVGGRFVAGQVAVGAGRQLGPVHPVLGREGLGRFAIVVAGHQRLAVGVGDTRRLFGEFGVDISQGRIERAIVQPEHQAHGEEVAAAVALLLPQAAPFDRQAGELGHVHLEKAVLGKAAVLERIGLVAGLLHPLVVERVAVDDQDAAGNQIREVRYQGGRVHGHQRLDLVAGRINVFAGEVNLEAAYAGLRAARSPDFGREVGERGNVVACQGGSVGQLGAGQLHAVARIAAEANRGRFKFYDGFRITGDGSHFSLLFL
jgi:hypothetical protein